MALKLHMTDTINAISELRVEGLEIARLKEVPEQADDRGGAIMFPHPDKFIQNFNVARNSMGSATALKTAHYVLAYQILTEKVGGSREIGEAFEFLVQIINRLVTVVVVNDWLDGAVDVEIQDIVQVGVIKDPSRIEWYGCTFKLRIEDFLEVA